jgi:hypothetical protein
VSTSLTNEEVEKKMNGLANELYEIKSMMQLLLHQQQKIPLVTDNEEICQMDHEPEPNKRKAGDSPAESICNSK